MSPTKRIRKPENEDTSPKKKIVRKSVPAANLEEKTNDLSGDVITEQNDKKMEVDTASEHQQQSDTELSFILGRSSDDDIITGKKLVAKVKQLVEELRILRSENGSEVTEEKLSAHRRNINLHILLLKRLNRYGHIRCKSLREAASSSKQSVDAKYLQLMNVQYEIAHLKKEIQKCLQFKSRDEDVSLVDFAVFAANAPVEVYDKDKIGDDQHLLRLATLEYELLERKRVSQQFKDAVKERNRMKLSIEAKRKKLANMLPQVDEIIKISRPLEESLGLESFFSEAREKMRHLPTPLFILYSQCKAYAEACGESLITVSIIGDIPQSASSVDPTTVLAEDDEDDDNGAADDARSSREMSSAKITMGDGANRLFKEHPLKVVIEVSAKGRSEKINMTFSFIICLNIVAVKPVMPGFSGNDFSSILHDLFLGDSAADTPNPSNHFILENYKVGSFTKAMKNIGFAFKWAQQICGLDFSTVKAGEAINWDASVSAGAISQVIRMIQDRVVSRIELGRQVSSLEKRIVPLPPVCLKDYPAKISTSIVKFSAITAEEYRTALEISPESFDETQESALHFCASLSKAVSSSSKETLNVYIEAMQNYPNSVPKFSLMFTPHRSSPIVNWKPIVRQIEESVNVRAAEYCGQQLRTDLLSIQMYQVMCGFEVMCDSYRTSERVYPRAFKGRDRCRPLVYKPSTGLFLFQ